MNSYIATTVVGSAEGQFTNDIEKLIKKDGESVTFEEGYTQQLTILFGALQVSSMLMEEGLSVNSGCATATMGLAIPSCVYYLFQYHQCLTDKCGIRSSV